MKVVFTYCKIDHLFYARAGVKGKTICYAATLEECKKLLKKSLKGGK